MFVKSKTLAKFTLAKSVENTLHHKNKQNYPRNFEKSLIISLIITIVVFRIAANIHIEQKSLSEEDIKLTLIDVLNIPPEIENPPELKMEKVVAIEPEKNHSEEENPILEELEELLEEKEDVKLTINSNDIGGYLASSSPLGSISAPELRLRQNFHHAEGSIALRSGKSFNELLAESKVDFDVGKVKTSERTITNDEVSVNLAAKTDQTVEESFRDSQESSESDDISLGLTYLNERIISFASSTIGTEDYKLWNKLHAELERISQGRYGPIPKEIRHSKIGFILTFSYSDGTKHEIHWRKSGRVWIKVIGKSNKSTVQELRRSLESVLSLTLNN